jgi:hypothetical protein
MVDFCGLARPENHFALLRSLLRSGVGDASTPNNSIDIKRPAHFCGNKRSNTSAFGHDSASILFFGLAPFPDSISALQMRALNDPLCGSQYCSVLAGNFP